jgi:hypothetical protein
MARPRRGKVVIFPVKLWLIPGQDDDIIEFLQAIPSRQRAGSVLRAMRNGIANRSGPPMEDEGVDQILDMLGNLWS